jgi:putative copper resistance protein D
MIDARSPAVATPPTWSDLITQWRPDPLSLTVLAAMTAGYVLLRVRSHRAGLPWRARRDATFGIGILAGVWVSSGVAQARSGQLEWVWIGQLLLLLLVVPLLVFAGQPVALARDVTGPDGPTERVLRSAPVRVLGHPLVGPALVPAVFLVILFAGVGESAASHPWAGWALHVVLLLIGALIALPLVDSGRARTSLMVALALAVGMIELIMDAFPGIAMRLAGHPLIPYFATHTPPWAGGWLYQQHEAGGLLWVVAEVLDLPFMILVVVLWLRTDAAEAARIDSELDAIPPGGPAVDDERPWFLDDPQLRDRYRF